MTFRPLCQVRRYLFKTRIQWDTVGEFGQKLKERSLLGSFTEYKLLPIIGFYLLPLNSDNQDLKVSTLKIAFSGIFSKPEEIVDSIHKIYQGFKKMASENINEAQLKVMQNMEELVIDTYNRWVGYRQV